MRKLISLTLTAVILISLCACGWYNNFSYSFSSMGTLMSLTLYADNKSDADRMFEKIKETADRLDALFSTTSNQSEISVLNSSKESASVSAETAGLIKKSLEASRLTKGAFDITVFPVLSLWGFNDKLYGVPSDADIKAALKTIGWEKLSVNNNTVEKNGISGVSLGGIAKGYLGDVLLNMTLEAGIPAVLSLGGNIVLSGNKPNKPKWTVAVKNPLDASKDLCEFLQDGNTSVVTSGAYERYFEFEGKKYHHIINPETGYPADSDIVSVTVIGENGTFCDAFSTAAFVMGSKKAVAFFKEHNDFDYIILTTDNKIHVSKHFDSFKIIDTDTFSLCED